MPDQSEQKQMIKEAIREAFGFESEEQISQFKLVMPTLIDMAKDWQAALKIGKWVTGLTSFAALIFGIAEAFKALFSKK